MSDELRLTFARELCGHTVVVDKATDASVECCLPAGHDEQHDYSALVELMERATTIIPRGQSTGEEITFTNVKEWLDGESNPIGEAALIIEALAVLLREAAAALRGEAQPEEGR
jgi:hypothetical protein